MIESLKIKSLQARKRRFESSDERDAFGNLLGSYRVFW